MGVPVTGNEPPFNSLPFCDGKWYANGYTHWCIKRRGHGGRVLVLR